MKYDTIEYTVPEINKKARSPDTMFRTSSRTLSELGQRLSSLFNPSSLAVSAKPIVVFQGKAPTVCKSIEEFCSNEELKLRTKEQTNTSSNVKLLQFDPNFFSQDYICCRFPGCNERKLTRYNTEGAQQKEDLYMCPGHRDHIEDYVAKMCSEKGISISHEKVDYKGLHGYTSLIGVLENGHVSLTKPSFPQLKDIKQRIKQEDYQRSVILREICLNTRNYLIIVSALLNLAGCDNLVTSLAAPLYILQLILKILQESPELRDAILETTRELVTLLKEVIEHISFSFGVIPVWVNPSSININSGEKIGAGIGGFVGLLGCMGGPLVGTLTTAGGSFFGGLIGSGLYDIQRQYRVPEDLARRVQEYQGFARVALNANEAQGGAVLRNPLTDKEQGHIFYLNASSGGDLSLAVLK